MAGHIDPPDAPEQSPRDLEVAVGPVVGGRRGRRPWLAFAGIALVIASFIVASRLFPAVPPPTVGVSPSPTERPMPTPTSAASPGIVLTAAELRAGLADGSLDGAIVLADGGMERGAFPCPSSGPSGTATCWSLLLVGLDDIPIAVDAAVAAAVAADVPGGRLLFLAGSGTLIYLGRAQGPIERPVSVTGLLASEPASEPIGPEVLVPVSGWLSVEGVHACPSAAADGTPCPSPGPWLTDDMPHANGVLVSEQGVAVRLDDGARLPIDANVAAGPFLLRSVGAPGRGAAWHVVARLDLAAVVRVTLP